jgi:hypothetical protein
VLRSTVRIPTPPGRWCVVRPSADLPRRAGVSYTWGPSTTGNPEHIAIYANMPREQFEHLPLVFSQKELLVWEARAAQQKAEPDVSIPIPPMSDSPSTPSQLEPIRLWVNVYPHNRISDVYHTSDGADLQAEPGRLRRAELREWIPDTGEVLEELKRAPLYQPHEHSLGKESFPTLVNQWLDLARSAYDLQDAGGFHLLPRDPKADTVRIDSLEAWTTAWFKERGYDIKFEFGPKPLQFNFHLVNPAEEQKHNGQSVAEDLVNLHRDHLHRRWGGPEHADPVPPKIPNQHLWEAITLRHGHMEYASVSTGVNAHSWVFNRVSVANDLVKLHRDHLHCRWEVQNILTLLPLSATPHARVKVLVTSEPNPKVLMHVANDRLVQEIKQAHNQVVDLIRQQEKGKAECVSTQKY